MKPVIEYTIVDHGIEHCQYFQGEGTSYTEFTDCATGIGDSAYEAMEDALENLAQGDWNISTIPNRQSKRHHKMNEECYYHLTVKVR